MSIGAFSISLTVKDIELSKEFYQKLGFTEFGGDINQKWLILQNGDCTIGLFEGMFDSNIMTFNPGWDNNAQEVNPFTDIREIQKQFKNKGITFDQQTDQSTEGPASFVITDPDGNKILVDQHR
jgi:catechol 2,3-dioxygenase-like lactoylglutathione lyase family enzyme